MKRERKAFGEYLDLKLRRLLNRLHFLDEIRAHLGLTRLYGRAAPGKRVEEGTPGYSGPHYSIIAALSQAGVSAPWILAGAMDGAAFRA